jgi:enoyl-CoA hydratase/carnithine racemase
VREHAVSESRPDEPGLEGEVLLDLRDGIAVITLNRPRQLNAMNQAMFTGLARAFIRVAADESVKVAILTGSGRAFSAGLDLRERQESGARGLGYPDTTPLVNPFWPGPRGRLDKPVIAAVNGYAMGGGFYLALQSDLCVAADTAQFEISEIWRGCVAGWETGFLHALPYKAWMEIALGGRLDARRAYDIGLVNAVVTGAELLPSALRMAESIMRVAPGVRRRNLELLRSLSPRVPESLLDLEEVYIEEARAHPDGAEAVSAFTEKRPPAWAGDNR